MVTSEGGARFERPNFFKVNDLGPPLIPFPVKEMGRVDQITAKCEGTVEREVGGGFPPHNPSQVEPPNWDHPLPWRRPPQQETTPNIRRRPAHMCGPLKSDYELFNRNNFNIRY